MKTTKPFTTILITLIILSCFVSLYKVENASAIGQYGNIVFRQTGLASGTSWTINIRGANYTTTDAQYSKSLVEGVCTYIIYVPAGYTSSSTLTGTMGILAGTTTYVDVVFTADASYSVTFTQNGLASGTNWSVTFNGNNQSSTTDTITFTEINNGNFTYSVTAPLGYVCSSDSSGTITVANDNINCPITFIPNPNWQMYRNSITHTGYTASDGPITNSTLWSKSTVASARSSPAVYNGVVYVGGANVVSALNVSTGSTIWSYCTNGIVASGPCIDSGVVFVGCGDMNVYALNATTGSLVWIYTTSGAVNSSPVVTDGVVYVVASDGYTYALNQTTGSLIWKRSTGYTSYSSAAVANGFVYVFSSSTTRVNAINATTGNISWSFVTSNSPNSSPTINDDILYIGTYGVFYAVNTTTHTQIWNYTIDSEFRSTAAVANGAVYVGASDGNLYAFNATTGILLWTYTAGDFSWSSPVVSGQGIVYIGCPANNIMYALNASSGSCIWQYLADAYFISSPAISNGALFASTGNGKLYAFAPLPSYSLTMKTVGQGNVLPGNTTLITGSTVNLIAVPVAGWSFSNWSGAASGNSNTTIVMDSDKTVTATFVENTYTLTMITVGNGTVNPGNVTTYHYGDTVDIEAINAIDWSFSGWSGDTSGTTNKTITINSNTTIIATFRNSYNVTFQMYIDDVLSASQDIQCDLGKNCTIFIMTLPKNYTFINAIVDGANTTDTIWTFLFINQDHTLQVFLSTTITTLIIQSDNGGTTDPGAGNYTYLYGEEANVTATPSEGYSFSHWLLDGAVNSTSSTIILTMDENHTLTPVFTQNQIPPLPPSQYQITIISSQGDSNGTYTVYAGDSFTASATSPVNVDSSRRWICTGYKIDDGPAITGTNYTFTDINSNHEITFLWQEQYYIQFASNPQDAGYITQNQWMTPGTHPIQAAASANYTFTSWTTTGSATVSSANSASTTLTITGPAVITANFENTNTLIAIKTTNNQTYPVILTGNITAQQMTNMTITPHPENSTTNVTFTVTGPAGQAGSSTIALPKNAIPYGSKPLVYIDGVLAENQTCTEDNDYYYIFYTTHFSTHTISILFTTSQDSNPTPTPTATPTPTPASTPQPTSTTNPTATAAPSPTATRATTQIPAETDPAQSGAPAAIAIAIALIVLILAAAVYRKKQKNQTP